MKLERVTPIIRLPSFFFNLLIFYFVGKRSISYICTQYKYGMDKKLINKLIFSKAGIFVMLSLLVVVFVCVMEWGTSSNKGRQGIFSDNNSGKEAVRHFKEGEKLFKKGDD